MINQDLYEIIGYRFMSPDYCNEPKVGDVLEHSNIWDGDDPTDEELNGTCAFESLDLVKEYAKYSKGWIVKVGGTHNGYGDLTGEILIGDCEVLSVENHNL